MERTYVFNSDGGNGSGSKLDITAMLPGMLGGYRGVDPNVLAMLNGNGGFGGQNGIWGVIYLAIVASIFGWNNGGFWWVGGGGGGGADLGDVAETGYPQNLQEMQDANCSCRPYKGMQVQSIKSLPRSTARANRLKVRFATFRTASALRERKSSTQSKAATAVS